MASHLLDSFAILRPMNKLHEYFQGERGRAAELARSTGQAASFLREIALGSRPCPAKLAVRIELHTGKQVTRKDLLPNDWPEIWPELVAHEAAQIEAEEARHA